MNWEGFGKKCLKEVFFWYLSGRKKENQGKPPSE
jgi:hypothetical protein